MAENLGNRFNHSLTTHAAALFTKAVGQVRLIAPLGAVEQRHEAEIHVRLHVTVKEA
jgi:hypothetical protein